MSTITLCKYDNSFGYILTDSEEIVLHLWDALSFWADKYKFMPSYINGSFDGKIRLIDLDTRKYPLGITNVIYDFCKMHKIECRIEKSVLDSFNELVDKSDVEHFIHNTPMYSKGEVIEPREDQIAAVWRAIKMKRCVNICPTSFGKSLSITLECLWHINKVRRCIIIVPTKDLVIQFYNDITDYATRKDGTKESWYPKMHTLYAGQSREIDDDTDIVISTWQTLARMDEGFLNLFDVIIIDETHKSAATVLRKLMESAVNVEYRTGWTGTLANQYVNELIIKGEFGPAKEITTTKTLMDSGIVAKLKIFVARLKYSDTIAKNLIKCDIATQYKFMEEYTPRTNMITDIASVQQKTGLMLYRHISHGKEIFEMLRLKCPDKNLYFIHGGHYQMNNKKYKNMEELKKYIENDVDGIIIANYPVVGTGISIKNLHWMIFAAPVKSFISTIQGIGRILRISETKKKAILIDIVDDFCYRTKSSIEENYAVRHFHDRFSIYNENKFEYNMKMWHVQDTVIQRKQEDITKYE